MKNLFVDYDFPYWEERFTVPYIEGVTILFVEILYAEHTDYLGELFPPGKEIYFHLLLELDKHFGDPADPSWALDYTGIPPNRFRKEFRDITGAGFHDYLMLLRTFKGASRLVNTTDPVERIAYDCGFQTPATFRKRIVKHYGMNPVSLRLSKVFNSFW